MNRLLAIVVPLAAAAALLPVALTARAQPAPASSAGPVPAVGGSCVVHFRRDVLGMAARTIVPPDTSVVGESRASLTATFRRMDDRWIVVSRDKDDARLTWIARDAVLMLEAGVQ